MFAKNSKAYSVYLLFRFVCSLAVSMSTVLSIVYHLEVVQLDAFQLVLVGTVLETSCFLFGRVKIFSHFSLQALA